MRPTFSQQTAVAGLSALAHLSVAGLLLTFAVPPPPAPPKPLPVTVTLIPAGSAPSSAAAAAATPGASGPPSAAAASPVAAPAVAPEVAPPPLPVSPPVALAPFKPEPKPEPKPKPETASKPKPKVEPQPKPKPLLATKPPPKSVARATPPTRLPKADSATPIMPAQASMAGPAGVATGANGGAAPAKSGSGSSLRGTAPDGHAAGDSQATPAYQPKPTYPAFARRLGHEGRVVIRIQVLSSGAVAAASIERSSGYAVLDEAALASIKRWRFRPAQRAGQPVDATLNVPITFKLQEQG